LADSKISFKARVLRKMAELPRYIVIKLEQLADQTSAFPAMVRLNGSAPFARTIRPWGKGSNVFFFNLTAPQCKAAGVDTGDQCLVEIYPLG
jgi:hypothetical protein